MNLNLCTLLTSVSGRGHRTQEPCGLPFNTLPPSYPQAHDFLLLSSMSDGETFIARWWCNINEAGPLQSFVQYFKNYIIEICVKNLI